MMNSYYNPIKAREHAKEMGYYWRVNYSNGVELFFLSHEEAVDNRFLLPGGEVRPITDPDWLPAYD